MVNPRGRLFRKYAVLIVSLVGGVSLAGGLFDIYFSFQDHHVAIFAIQREKALAAASKIEQFIREIERQVAWAAQGWIATPLMLEQRRFEYRRLLRQASAVAELSLLDASGREQLKVSRFAMNVTGSNIDFSRDPKFLEAKAGKTYFGPVYFREESEPYMTIAIAGKRPEWGVTVAEVNLKFTWDVVSQIKVGRAGRAYVVDGRGHLIAHPDISLVLQNTDLSSLIKVQRARMSTPRSSDAQEQLKIARDLGGNQVLTASAAITPPGWLILVELPRMEALEPLRSSIVRTAALMMLGIGLSVLLSLFLARRMVRPIQALQTGVARIGAGGLDHRIAIHTDDEIGLLADDFNKMSAALQEAHATLERRVAERTSELAIANQKLDKVSRHKSEFLASMSHELRTPLTAIIGFSEVLSQKMFGELNDKQSEYMDDIVSSGRHLLSLINDILDLSKVEAGRMELDLTKFDLPTAIDNALILIRERAMRHGISLRHTVDERLGEVLGDERKFKQILLNLLSNAVKFTPEGGRIHVDAALTNGAVEISVSDTGIGIAPENQETIFEEFRQVGTDYSKKREGTGLGLTLTRKFVELLGGKIWVESEVGKGSTFTFTLPLNQEKFDDQRTNTDH